MWVRYNNSIIAFLPSGLGLKSLYLVEIGSLYIVALTDFASKSLPIKTHP
jgi:hypothetical protein